MTNDFAQLSVDIRSYWHAGTGRGASSYMDALVHTDSAGLPVLPGRTLKGLLRDAVYRAEQWGWDGVPPQTTEALFGSVGFDADKQQRQIPRAATQPGLLGVSDARLPAAVIAWIRDGKPMEQSARRKTLFTEMYSTAVDHATGTAREQSLRGTQVVIPLKLESEISIVPLSEYTQHQQMMREQWRQVLNKCLPLIRAVGAYRSRGLGRAVVRLEG